MNKQGTMIHLTSRGQFWDWDTIVAHYEVHEFDYHLLIVVTREWTKQRTGEVRIVWTCPNASKIRKSYATGNVMPFTPDYIKKKWTNHTIVE
jgi:hypothetical protein